MGCGGNIPYPGGLKTHSPTLGEGLCSAFLAVCGGRGHARQNLWQPHTDSLSPHLICCGWAPGTPASLCPQQTWLRLTPGPLHGLLPVSLPCSSPALSSFKAPLRPAPPAWLRRLALSTPDLPCFVDHSLTLAAGCWTHCYGPSAWDGARHTAGLSECTGMREPLNGHVECFVGWPWGPLSSPVLPFWGPSFFLRAQA